MQPLLDAVIDYLPSPLDVPPIRASTRRPSEVDRAAASLDAPFSALAFKVMSDPFVGKLTYFRVYSGTLKAGDRVLNTSTGKTERIGRILQMHANHREEREEIGAGEIAAGVGLKQTTTGDTLAVESAPIVLESMTFPEPVISVAVEPKSKADQDKLGSGLARLAEEDPTFRVHTDDETGQTLIAGMGELHLEIIIDRLKREFNVDANIGRPQVAYRETIGSPPRRFAAGSSARRAVRGSTATSRSTCCPRHRAPATSSSTRSSAARSRRSTSRRSTPESSRRWAPAYLPATRSSSQDRARRRQLPRRRLERAGVQDRRLDGIQGRDEAGEAEASRARDVSRGHDTRGLPRRRDR